MQVSFSKNGKISKFFRKNEGGKLYVCNTSYVVVLFGGSILSGAELFSHYPDSTDRYFCLWLDRADLTPGTNIHNPPST